MRRALVTATVTATVTASVALAAGCSTTGSPAHSTSSAPPTAAGHHSAAASRAAASVPHVVVRTALRLPVGVSRTVVVADGARLLVLGGLAPGDTTTGRVWSIDPATGSVHAAGTLATAVHDASGAHVGGSILVFGGGAATGVAAVQAYSAGRSHVVGSLPGPRSDSASAVIGATAYVVGGFTGRGMARDVLATTDGRHFRVVARLPIGVRYPAVAAVGGAVYVVGGELATTEGTLAGGQTDAVQRIDPSTGSAGVIGHLGSRLGHATAFALGGRLFVAGGRHGSAAVSTVVEVDIGNGHARTVGRLPVAESDAAAVVVGSVAWLVGGETTGPGAPARSVLALRLSAP